MAGDDATPEVRTGRQRPGPTTPTVVLLGTLDTKGADYQWLHDQLVADAVTVTVMDTGTGDPHGFTSPITIGAAEIAAAAGVDLAALRDHQDRGEAVTSMGEGAAVLLSRLAEQGAVQGVLSVGGSGGSSIFARAVRDLPIGLPKQLVSTMASGDVSPYVGANDVTITYSVVDVAGINRISREVLGNAAAAVAAMAHRYADAGTRGTPTDDKPLVAATMFGVTTPAVETARERLTELGYEVLVFHATGAGGRAVEALARSGLLAGVLDLTTTELADDLVGGVLSAGPDRLTAAGAAGLPQVVSLGALDMVNFGPRDTVPQEFEGRLFFEHNPTVTLMRTTPAENSALGSSVGAKLAKATGPTVLIIPRGGVSALDAPGLPFADDVADQALFEAVLSAVGSSPVEVIDDDRHVNDAGFARRAADRLDALIKERADA
ncbi:MAG TPA: Tm-1-like ATP-binding domain-containing protein [Microlunatus sp.]